MTRTDAVGLAVDRYQAGRLKAKGVLSSAVPDGQAEEGLAAAITGITQTVKGSGDAGFLCFLIGTAAKYLEMLADGKGGDEV